MVLSFGATALIYFVAEEVLVEAIEAEESLISTANPLPAFSHCLTLRSSVYPSGYPQPVKSSLITH